MGGSVVADHGPHSEECANADGGDCYCDCKGTLHGLRHLGGKLRDMAKVRVTKKSGGGFRVERKDTGRPPGGGTKTEKARKPAGAEGRDRSGNRDEVQVTGSTTPKLPAHVLEQLAKTRASLPKTEAEWRKPLESEKALDKFKRAVSVAEDNVRGAELALAEGQQERERILANFRLNYPNARMNRLSGKQRETLYNHPYDPKRGFGLQRNDEDIEYSTAMVKRYREALRTAQSELQIAEARRRKGLLPYYPEGEVDGAAWVKVPMPPDEYEQHLSAVMDVGRQVLAEARKAFHADPEWKRLRSEAEDAEGEYRRLNLSASSDDPRLWEALKAHRRTRIAHLAREQKILRDLMSSAREFGGATHADVNYWQADNSRAKKARDDAEEMLSKAEQFYPSDWVRESSKRKLNIGASDRAFHNENDLLLTMPTSHQGHGYVGAHGQGAEAHALDVTVHEMGHRMEATIHGLTELEFTLVRRRSTAPDGKTLQKQVELYRQGSGEWAFPDTWANTYAGKTYERRRPNDPSSESWEAFQVGMQDVWSRLNEFDKSDDLQQFVIGALLALG